MADQWIVEGSSGRTLKIKMTEHKIMLRIDTADGGTQFTCQVDALRTVMTEIFPPPKPMVASAPAGTVETGERKTF